MNEKCGKIHGQPSDCTCAAEIEYFDFFDIF